MKGCHSAVFRSGTIYSYYDPSIWLLVIHLSQLVMMSTVLYSLHVVEIKKDRPRTHRLLIQGLLSQGSRPPALVFSRALKAGRGVGGLYSEKGEGSGVPCWSLSAQGSWRWAKQKWDILYDWLVAT